MASLSKSRHKTNKTIAFGYEDLERIKKEWEGAVDSVNDSLVCLIDQHGVVKRSNLAIEKWSKASIENVKGKKLHSLVHPRCDDPNCYLKNFLALSNNVTASSHAVNHHAYDEKMGKELELQLFPIAQEGVDDQLVLTIRDLEKVNFDLTGNQEWQWKAVDQLEKNSGLSSHSEKVLNLSDYKFLEKAKLEWEAAVDSLPQMLFVVDMQGQVLRANRAVERWKVGDVKKIVGVKLHYLLHANCTDSDCGFGRLEDLIQKAERTGQSGQLQFYDESLKKHLLIQIAPNYSPLNTGQAAVIQITDVSELNKSERDLKRLAEVLHLRVRQKNKELKIANEKLKIELGRRKLAEAKLRANRDELSMLLNRMGEGMVVQHETGISYANPRLRRMLGLPQNRLIGRRFDDFLELDEPWNDTAQPNLPYIARIKKGNDKKTWVKVSPQGLDPSKHGPEATFSVITDIHDHIEIKNRLIETEHKLRHLNRAVALAQENERKRIASELHDGVGQTLSAIKFYVENTVHRLITKKNPGTEDFDVVIKKLQDAIEEVRRISMDLRPSVLDDIGLLATLAWFVRESRRLMPSIDFKFQSLNITEEDIPLFLKTEIFRIAQEGVSNASKYSEAKLVNIGISIQGEHIILDIKDDGVGFDVAKIYLEKMVKSNGGLGLISIKERVENFKGKFTIQSSAKGTQIQCKWKLESA